MESLLHMLIKCGIIWTRIYHVIWSIFLNIIYIIYIIYIYIYIFVCMCVCLCVNCFLGSPKKSENFKKCHISLFFLGFFFSFSTYSWTIYSVEDLHFCLLYRLKNRSFWTIQKKRTIYFPENQATFSNLHNNWNCWGKM